MTAPLWHTIGFTFPNVIRRTVLDKWVYGMVYCKIGYGICGGWICVQVQGEW